MITCKVTNRSGREFPVGTIGGIPRGMLLSKSYVGHQITRWARFSNPGFPFIRKDHIVEILSGVRNGRTTGRPISVHITDRFISVLNAVGPVNRRLIKELTRIAANTIVRKHLEDRGVFVGSYVIQVDSRGRTPLDTQMHIQSLMKASCGAYKITEVADDAPGRVLMHRSASPSRQLMPGHATKGTLGTGTFELIISGIDIHPSERQARAEQILRSLVRRLSGKKMFRIDRATLRHPSVSTKLTESVQRGAAKRRSQKSEVRLRLRTRAAMGERVEGPLEFTGSSEQETRLSLHRGGVSFLSVATELVLPEVLVRLGMGNLR